MAINWKTVIQVIEVAGNIAELAVAPELIPLTSAAEVALNPIFFKLGSGSVDVQTEVMAFYATAITALSLIKAKGALDAATSAKIDEYLAATQEAMKAYFVAGQGFDPSLYTAVTPIV